MHLLETPDFTKDPRRRKRALAALDLCYEVLLQRNGVMTLHHKKLREILGQPNTNFAKFLHTLFLQDGFYVVGKISYKYRVDNERRQKLEQLVDHHGFLEFAKRHGKSFEHAPARETYKISSDRHYNWWTNCAREVRKELFIAQHGVLYDYDLQAAKPALTLIAWKNWVSECKPNEDSSLPTWEKYVLDRKTFRVELAEELGVSTDQAKDIIQRILNSAVISPNKDSGFCQDYSIAKVRLMMKSDKCTGLADDFKKAWNLIKDQREPGQTAGEFMSRLYNSLERQVMDVIDSKITTEAWYVHDGFMTYEPVDVHMLEREVLDKHGFKIKIDEEIIK